MRPNRRNIARAAIQLNVSSRTLYSRISTGTLKAYVVGHNDAKLYVNPAEVKGWRTDVTRRRMTERHPEFLALYDEGAMDSEIAASLGQSRERVRQIRETMHLPKNPRKPTLPKTGASL